MPKTDANTRLKTAFLAVILVSTSQVFKF